MVHSTAIIARGAEIGRDVDVGPYAVIGPGTQIGDGCRIESHTIVEARTILGAGNRVGPHAVIGTPPQHRTFHSDRTRVVIGADNQIREFVTIHRGTQEDRAETRIGSHGLFMAYAHIGHDCVIGDRVTLANGVQVGGHVVVQDDAQLGGLAAVHQHGRVGRWAMVAGGSMVTRDVPPFCLAAGQRIRVFGLNRLGLARGGFTAEARHALRQAYGEMYLRGRPQQDVLAQLRESPSSEVQAFVQFFATTQRGVCAAQRSAP